MNHEEECEKEVIQQKQKTASVELMLHPDNNIE